MENFEELKDIGSYRIIRSSTDKKALLGWGDMEYDKTCERWFESTGGGYCTLDDAQYLLDADESAAIDYRIAHPNLSFRESYWDIICGEDDVVAERALFVLEERESRAHHVYNYFVDNISLEELERWKKAVREWHLYGELKLDNLKCNSSWETEID